MTKHLLLASVFMIGSMANAKSYHSADDSAAVIYFMQDAKTVNALYCDEVDKTATKAIMKSLKSDPNTFDSEKCQKLSDKGITEASIAKKIPELKQQMIQAIAAFSKMMGGMTKSVTGDDETGKEVEDMFTALTDQQKAQIEQINAANVFGKFVSEAKNPMTKSIDSKELEEEVDIFSQLEE